MAVLRQPESAGVQVLLAGLHLYALCLASIAIAGHGAAVLHHLRRAGFMAPPRDETARSATLFLRERQRR